MKKTKNTIIKKPRGQMSEAFITSIFLTLSGGFQDAYTYCIRGEVFANAQTGNIVLMSANLYDGKFSEALRFLFPILAFAVGIYIAELIRRRCKTLVKIHWRQLVLLAEITILSCVAFIPQSLNMLANILVSFACAMQVQTFRKVGGNVYATTMCIGNIRSAVELLCAFFHTGEKPQLKKSLQYFAVIALFGVGAGAGHVITEYCGETAILISCLLLLTSFVIMFIKEDIIGDDAA